MDVLYLTLESADNHIELPKVLNLKNKAVGLIDINGYYTPRRTLDKNLFLCCDFIKDSIIHNPQNSNLYPIVRLLNFKSGKTQLNGNDFFYDKIKEVYTKLIFLPCNRDEVDSMRLYLIDEQGNLPSFDECQLTCSLLIFSLKN